MIDSTGIIHIPGWYAKAWWSMGQRTWLVQLERACPDQGGWIRGWLATPHTDIPQTFPTLDAALAAAEAFCATPQDAAWCDNRGVW